MKKFYVKIFFVLCLSVVFSFLFKQASIKFSDTFIDFDNAMVNSTKLASDYQKLLVPGSATANNLALLRSLYNKNYIMSVAPANEPKIPKIIHQIWLGSPFPECYKAWQQTWKDKHPDWQYKLWTDTDVAHFKLTNQELFDKATNYGEKSDIFRYEILYRYGGLYIDTDFASLVPLDFLNYRYDFYSCLIPPDSNLQCGIGILAAKPEHPLFKKIIDVLHDHTTHQDILARTGPTFFTNILLQELPHLEGTSIIFPSNYFYPFSFTQKWSGYYFPWWWRRPETLGIHYWAGSWIEKSWIKTLKYYASRLCSFVGPICYNLN